MSTHTACPCHRSRCRRHCRRCRHHHHCGRMGVHTAHTNQQTMENYLGLVTTTVGPFPSFLTVSFLDLEKLRDID